MAHPHTERASTDCYDQQGVHQYGVRHHLAARLQNNRPWNKAPCRTNGGAYNGEHGSDGSTLDNICRVTLENICRGWQSIPRIDEFRAEAGGTASLSEDRRSSTGTPARVLSRTSMSLPRRCAGETLAPKSIHQGVGACSTNGFKANVLRISSITNFRSMRCASFAAAPRAGAADIAGTGRPGRRTHCRRRE